ncbi:MAG: hypothetical protein G01um101477_307 [Candidatus Doudnabacteria bacterium Gr01-1014_77]|uniref:Uncharacterized protein n=1 Tax=Candidatus Doudnabacteria bacterium Gr01-1014_77 TaxID=2017133 RepID=A0A554JBW6_9BACT|nr:MAG: hypothetical protein G01um101477_307 [Candidatus Doudnabacteria bacterium Gr01-1014_77]
MFENTKKQSQSLLILSAIFLIGTLCIVFLTDPNTINKALLFLFYVSLSAFLMSFFTFVLYSYRGRKPERLYTEIMNVSLRQAFLLTLLIIVFLVLSSHQLLFWWLGLVLIITLVFVEGFFLSN